MSPLEASLARDNANRFLSTQYERHWRPSVVIAEDEPLLRDLVAWELGNLGCRVTEVSDGNQLLDYFHEALVHNTRVAPDVLVTDVRMPGVTGIEAVTRFRELGWNGSVVVMTAFGQAQTEERARRADAWAFLSKPFDMAELVREVRKALPA